MGTSGLPLRVERPDRPALDLGRDTCALFGLVFDALTLDQAVAAVQGDVRAGRRSFISTPNVNFVAMARGDAAFRRSVLRSDLSLADGAPIVWAARLAGLPLAERVAGADLFDRLRRGGTPMRVYFFGGPDGVAEAAGRRLDEDGGPLRCVGFDSPGFGDLEALSGAERLRRIDDSQADFLVVALGARKGQAWIEHNLGRLRPMVACHLGAVVNFVAGRVARAPAWIARSGLEWLWRIGQEPALWRRYAADGMALAGLLATAVLPLALARLAPRDRTPARIERRDEAGGTTLRLQGAWQADRLGPLRAEFAGLLSSGATVRVDLGGVTAIDSAVVALLLRVDCWQQEPKLVLPGTARAAAVRRVIRGCGAADLIGD